MKTYKPKELIEGRNLGLPIGKYVAVPKQKVIDGGVKVTFNSEQMLISTNSHHLLAKQFPDKFLYNKFYTLLYYKWNPDVMNLGI